MFGLVIAAILIFIWGLWFLRKVNLDKETLGWKVKNILILAILSSIPVINFVVFLMSFLLLMILLSDYGYDETFNTTTNPAVGRFRQKWINFMNHEILKK